MLYYLSLIVEKVLLLNFPIAASLHTLKSKNEKEQTRWILHWILFVVLMAVVFPVVDFLEGILGEFIGSVLRILVSVGTLYHPKFLDTLVQDKILLAFQLLKGGIETGRTLLGQIMQKYQFLPAQKQQ